MPEFKLKDVNNDLIKKINLPQKIPARIGNKIEKKLDIEINVKGEKAEYSINSSKLMDVKEYMVDAMLDKYTEEIDLDELNKESYDKIAEYYWNELQSFMNKKKPSNKG